VFRQIQNLYMLSSLAPPSTSSPWTTTELVQMVQFAQAHGPEGPDAAREHLIASIHQVLSKPLRFPLSEQMSIGASGEYTFELYAHTNPDEFSGEADWTYRWVDRAPILKVPFEVASFDRLYSRVDIDFMQRLLESRDDPVGLYDAHLFSNNFLYDFYQLDFLWPYRAVGVAGGEFWNLQLGRDRLSWGPGHTGNLLVSDHLPFHDYWQFRMWHERYSFSTTILDFPPPADTDSTEGAALVSSLIAHRIEFSLFGRLHLAITESMMYEDDVLNLRYLNPFMIYHQYFMSARSNSFLTVEAQLSVLPTLVLYGQFGVDDLQVIGESAANPNAVGILAGLEYLIATPSDTLLLWTEFVYTDPMLYQRDGVDYIVHFAAKYPSGGTEYIPAYLGYPEGGDAVVLAGGLQWDDLYRSEASLTLEYLLLGETPFEAQYPPAEPEAVSPTGIVEASLSLTVSGSHRLSLLTHDLSLFGSLSYRAITNKGHAVSDPVHDVQCVLGLSYSL
jgi:hypothetical protein